MASELNKPVEIFFSYSHRDQDLRDQLETHLSTLKNQGFISVWHDHKILPGTEWAGEIDKYINTAQIILLLISADFLASPYCYGIEVKRAVERHDTDEARVIPIILRPCDWHHSPFGKLQVLPANGKPILSEDWHTKDDAFYNIALGIRKVIEDIQVLKASASIQDNNVVSFPKIDNELSLSKISRDKSFNPYQVRDEWIDYIVSSLQEAIIREDDLDFYTDNSQGYIQIRILFNQKTIYSLNIYKGSMSGGRQDDGISFSYSEGPIFSSGFNAWGNFKWDKKKELVVLPLLDMGWLSYVGDTKEYTKEDFLRALWNKIKLAVERSVR